MAIDFCLQVLSQLNVIKSSGNHNQIYKTGFVRKFFHNLMRYKVLWS